MKLKQLKSLNLKMKTEIYNNDKMTFFVFLLFQGFNYTIFYTFLYDYHKNTNRKRNKRALFGSLLFSLLILWLYTDKFRLFQIEYIYGDIKIKNVFNYDTRRINFFFSYSRENDIILENYQSGDITYFLSATNGILFTIKNNLVPFLLHTTERGSVVNIKAWRYILWSKFYHITSFENKMIY